MGTARDGKRNESSDGRPGCEMNKKLVMHPKPEGEDGKTREDKVALAGPLKSATGKCRWEKCEGTTKQRPGQQEL